MQHVIVLTAGLLASLPPVAHLISPSVARVMADLQSETLTTAEALAMVDGYYEQLNEQSLQASPFLGNPVRPWDDRGGRFSAMLQNRSDILQYEPIPGWRGTFGNATLSINRWGMRDRDRELLKPQGTIRVAMVGNSPVMGYGVDDHQTFSRVLETHLNDSGARDGRRCEVLNFGVGRYWAIHRRAQIDKRVLPFRPDVVIYFAHQDELFRTTTGLAAAIVEQVDLEDSCLDSLVADLEIGPGQVQGVVQAKLTQKLSEILRCTYARIIDSCRKAGAQAIYVYLPIPGNFEIPSDPRAVLKLAQDAGFKTYDFTGWEHGYAAGEVLAEGGADEHHPSPLGHQLIAEKLAKLPELEWQDKKRMP